MQKLKQQLFQYWALLLRFLFYRNLQQELIKLSYVFLFTNGFFLIFKSISRNNFLFIRRIMFIELQIVANIAAF